MSALVLLDSCNIVDLSFLISCDISSFPIGFPQRFFKTTNMPFKIKRDWGKRSPHAGLVPEPSPPSTGGRNEEERQPCFFLILAAQGVVSWL